MAVPQGFPTVAELQGSIELVFTYSLAFALVWFASYYSLGLSSNFSASETTRKLLAASATITLGFVLADFMMSYNVLGMFF